MPIVEKAKAVYHAANTFRENCLLKDGSLLFDDAKVWTTANLKTLKEHFNDNADFSDASFFDKLKKQLEPVNADVVRLAAEVLAVYYLFSNSVTERTKAVRSSRSRAGKTSRSSRPSWPRSREVSAARARPTTSGGPRSCGS